ncbi:hypothetical protein DLJ61_06400 [Gordonia terrae]|uniref:Histone-binding protein RBBP4-like N-terminal domain-containing protein n=1 Tax=Gordonia terrae TaxID=2055 RepID=A0AAD0NXG5_9ACTN|nr:hypothetical protein DLJ61_06400 [Gordonia terrae]
MKTYHLLHSTTCEWLSTTCEWLPDRPASDPSTHR